MWLATILTWGQNTSSWLQAVTGLTLKDLALFAGGTVMVLAVLWLGLYSGKPRYREAARFGWILLILAAMLIAYGIYRHDPVSGS